VKTDSGREPVLDELHALDADMKRLLAGLAPEVERHRAGSKRFWDAERYLIRRLLIRRSRTMKCAWADGVAAARGAGRAFTDRLRRWLD